jgi:hypothetical protein
MGDSISFSVARMQPPRRASASQCHHRRLYAHVVCCCRGACGTWLPENHPAYVVNDVIDQLDLSAMDEVDGSEKRGQPPYDPRMMAKLLVYGYCVGLFSSRRIIFLRGGVSQVSATGVAVSSSASAASACASRSLICERRSFSFFFIGHSSSPWLFLRDGGRRG